MVKNNKQTEKRNIKLIKFERDILKVLKKHKYLSEDSLDKIFLIQIDIVAGGLPRVTKYKKHGKR